MKDYMKYASLGFEILAYMGICVAAGYFLDTYLQTSKPWFLLSMSLVGCVAVIYRIIKTTDNPK